MNESTACDCAFLPTRVIIVRADSSRCFFLSVGDRVNSAQLTVARRREQVRASEIQSEIARAREYKGGGI